MRLSSKEKRRKGRVVKLRKREGEMKLGLARRGSRKKGLWKGEKGRGS